MGRLPLLECFDSDQPQMMSQADPGPSADWLDGHACGLEAGRSLAATAQTAVSAEISQTLADMSFGYTEARLQLLQSLRPLFRAIIGHVLPGIAETAQATHLIDLLNAAAALDSAVPIELTVHPSRITGLTALLPYAVGLPIMLVADPGIGQDQAVLRSGRVETALDVGAMIDGARAALGAIFETADERVNYG